MDIKQKAADKLMALKTYPCSTLSLVDLGFPRIGGANSPGAAPTYDFAELSRNLHEIERICMPGLGEGAASLMPPPIRSADAS